MADREPEIAEPQGELDFWPPEQTDTAPGPTDDETGGADAADIDAPPAEQLPHDGGDRTGGGADVAVSAPSRAREWL